jgi:hypothetical protein
MGNCASSKSSPYNELSSEEKLKWRFRIMANADLDQAFKLLVIALLFRRILNIQGFYIS